MSGSVGLSGSSTFFSSDVVATAVLMLAVLQAVDHTPDMATVIHSLITVEPRRCHRLKNALGTPWPSVRVRVRTSEPCVSTLGAHLV